MLEVYEYVTSNVCEVVIVKVNENVSSGSYGVVVVIVDDEGHFRSFKGRNSR